MKKIFLPIISISTICFLNSCYYDNFKELHPDAALPNANGSNCDTIGAISYSLTILPILNSNCTQNCHNGTGSGHDLTSWSSVNADASATTLGPSIDGTGSNPMPQGGGSLSACDVAKIKKWISAGAPNN